GGCSGFGLFGGAEVGFDLAGGGSGGGGAGVLVVGAQPAHQAAGFFGGAGGVEFDQAAQQFFLGGGLGFGLVGQRGGGAGLADELGGEVAPAVGLEHRAVEGVVQFAQHRHQALLVDRAFLGRERFAGAQLFEHVVHAGEGQLGVQGLLALAV